MQNSTNGKIHRYPVLTHLLRFFLAGIAEPLTFKVTSEDSDRLQDVLQLAEEELDHYPFFRFISQDGEDVVVSVRDIQLVNFLWQHELILLDETDQPEEPPNPQIKIYLRGRPEPYETRVDEPEEVAALLSTFEMLDPGEEPFLFFQDEDGELLAFQPRHLVLLSVPDQLFDDEEEEDEEEEEL